MLCTRSIPAGRLYAGLSLAAALVCTVAPASAQYRPGPMSEPAPAERYHLEAAADLWFPGASIFVSSESLGIPGTTIDFRTDLGLTDQHVPAFRLQLRPARKHKFRFQYIPIVYEQSATLTEDIVFNGQRYTLGLPVNSTLDWKAFRFGYEYDVITRNQGFFGVILEAKYTNVSATLTAPIRGLDEFDHAKVPIPAIGGVGRIYLVPSVSITGELTGFKVPQSLADRISKGSGGHYVDFDLYGTVSFTPNVGAQAGYRSLDVGYVVVPDTGSFTLKGLYVGAVVRY